MNDSKLCPVCGAPMKPDTAVLGVSPNLYNVPGWRCTAGYYCDSVGLIWLGNETPEEITRLVNINKQHYFIGLIRKTRGITQDQINGGNNGESNHANAS